MNISRSESGYASGLRTTPLMTLKIALLAPMPSPMVSTASMVKPGDRRSSLTP
jgi:hypothetical protein